METKVLIQCSMHMLKCWHHLDQINTLSDESENCGHFYCFQQDRTYLVNLRRVFLSLRDILTDAVKCRIAGGIAASVKIPVATQDSKNQKILNADHLFALSRCPCKITAKCSTRITVLCFNDSAGPRWAWPEPPLSLRMKN